MYRGDGLSEVSSRCRYVGNESGGTGSTEGRGDRSAPAVDEALCVTLLPLLSRGSSVRSCGSEGLLRFVVR